MQVQVNSDHNIVGTEALSSHIEATVNDAVGRFGSRITRVEVHVKDANSHKLGNDDKHCTMEARLAGLKPIAVTAEAASLGEAISSAADKLERALESRLGRLDETAGRSPREDEIVTAEDLVRLERSERGDA